MNSSYFIGIDIGTTSTKAIVFSATSEVKGMGNQGYPLLVPQAAWAEQDPNAILKAVVLAVRDAIQQSAVPRSQIAAICLSGAMHSVIAVDAQGTPLTHAIIWADNRSIEQTQQLKQTGLGHKLYRQTGTPIHPMSPLPKLMWLRQAEPDLFQRAAKFISIKEYVLYQWLDRFVVDHSIASATGLLNLEKLQWDETALDTAGIRSTHLSDLVPTTHILRGIQPNYAEAMGLDAQTPIVIGANDGVLANLGVGAISPQQIAVTIGTSSAVRTVVSQPITDEKERTFCYALTQDRWVIGGASNNGGIVLRWLRDRFCDTEMEQARQQNIDPYELMVQSAMQVSAGADGLLCIPFLSGERAPYWNPEARGIFFGVSLHHTKAHFIRSVLEGVMFAVYSISCALQELAGTAKEIRASGGFARSEAWRQMMADIFGYEVLIPQVYEGSAFGAAVLAMYATGAISQLETVEQFIHMGDRHFPHLENTQTYRTLFSTYERIYRGVEPEFNIISKLQKEP